MIQDLPTDIQENVRSRLLSGDFRAAKELHDEWVHHQTEKLAI